MDPAVDTLDVDPDVAEPAVHFDLEVEGHQGGIFPAATPMTPPRNLTKPLEPANKSFK